MPENNVVHLPVQRRNLIVLYEQPRRHWDLYAAVSWGCVYASVAVVWGFVFWAIGAGQWLGEVTAVVLTAFGPMGLLLCLITACLLSGNHRSKSRVPPTPLRIVVDNDPDDLPPAA